MALVVASIWAAGASAAAAKPTAEASIVGGHPASIAEFPSLAFVLNRGYGSFSGFSCTGTVIAPRIVLTAGHCVENIESLPPWKVSEYRIATGIANVAHPPPANVSRVEAAIAFPGFNPMQVIGDAGLLILSEPVTATPISLASPAVPLPLQRGTPLLLAGWGITDIFQANPPSVLQAGEINAQTPSYCKSRGGEPTYTPAFEICGVDTAHNKVADCFGDSGGPAIATRPDGTQAEVGIVSKGGLFCAADETNIFTRVEAVADWVNAWIATVEKGAPEPQVPKAHLPKLPPTVASFIDEATINEVIDSDFFEGNDPRPSCHSTGRASARCTDVWPRNHKLFHAVLTNRWAIDRNQVVLRGHWLIRSVSQRCATGPHPKRCPAKTITGP